MPGRKGIIMKKSAGKITVLFMVFVMALAMAGCAAYSAPTVDSFCAALDELGYDQVPDPGTVGDVTSAMRSFAAFGGGGYIVTNYADPYDTSITGHIRGCTTEVLCITEKGTRYLFMVFDNNENAKYYYDTLRNELDYYEDHDGVFIKKNGINAESYVFAGSIYNTYCYGGFYYKDNTVTVIDAYENDITNKSQVNMLLDKLGLPRP